MFLFLISNDGFSLNMPNAQLKFIELIVCCN